MSALHDYLDTTHQDDVSRDLHPDAKRTETDGQPHLAALVEAARRNEPCAWSQLVQRFTPLVRTTAKRYRLNEHDAEDVGQVVWLRLVEHIHGLREPLALPGWIATTARHESIRLAGVRGRTQLVDPQDIPAHEVAGDCPDVDAHLLQDEEVEAVREGLAELPTPQRDLLLLLIAEPRPTYQEISLKLGMPLGSIGPTRGRSLARLEAASAVSQCIECDRRDVVPRPRAA